MCSYVFQEMARVYQVHRAVLEVRQRGNIVRDDVNVGQWPGVNINESRSILLPTADVDQYLAVTIVWQRRLYHSPLKVRQL